MKLSKRLEAIASFIPSSGGIIDVGCNHAHICIYFAMQNKKRKIIGSDCNNLSLLEARKEIKKLNLENKIQLIVTNGLDNIVIDEDDTIIISGLGTRTIKSILKDDILKKINHIIIQSNNYLYELRKYMSENNFLISDELVIKDYNKTYVVINFKRSNKKVSYSEYELKYGPFSKYNEVYLNEQLKILEEKLSKVLKYDNYKVNLILNDIDYIKKQLGKSN